MKSLNSKKVCLYGLLTAAALLFGYVEYLVPLNFIAPGIKLGISNGVVLLLILNNNYKSAFLVNICRIVLSAFLFATPFSLVFSLTAGIISTLVMILLNRFKGFGVVGISAVGGAVHNLVQIIVARLTVGKGVFFYMPYLLLAGVLTGAAVGVLVWLMLKKATKINFLKFN